MHPARRPRVKRKQTTASRWQSSIRDESAAFDRSIQHPSTVGNKSSRHGRVHKHQGRRSVDQTVGRHMGGQ